MRRHAVPPFSWQSPNSIRIAARLHQEHTGKCVPLPFIRANGPCTWPGEMGCKVIINIELEVPKTEVQSKQARARAPGTAATSSLFSRKVLAATLILLLVALLLTALAAAVSSLHAAAREAPAAQDTPVSDGSLAVTRAAPEPAPGEMPPAVETFYTSSIRSTGKGPALSGGSAGIKLPK